MAVVVEVHGQRRGVLSVVSLRPEFFSQSDLRLLEAVAGWIGIVAHRAELFEQATRDAAQRGRREAADELARLTRRQQEIAVAVAQGLTNEEIAERLVLEPGTVANHVAAILGRLGVRNRTQIGVWAAERGLYRSDQEPQVDQPVDREGGWGRAAEAEPARRDGQRGRER